MKFTGLLATLMGVLVAENPAAPVQAGAPVVETESISHKGFLDRHDEGRVIEALSHQCRSLVCSTLTGCQPGVCWLGKQGQTKIIAENSGVMCGTWYQKYQCSGYFVKNAVECIISHPCNGVPHGHHHHEG